MPTYNSGAVSDAVIAFQKPITLQQGRGLRDNPLAIAEGSSGAPRVQVDAMADSVVGDTLLFGTGGTGRVFTTPIDATIEIPQATFRAFTTCSVRVYFELSTTTGGVNANAKVLKNGVAVLDQNYTLTSYASYTVDISLVAGDMVEITATGSGGNSARVRDIQYRTGTTRTCGGI